jgi:hypothetical protein
MTRIDLGRAFGLATLVMTACGPAPEAAPPPAPSAVPSAPPAPAADEAGARRVVELALASLGKRNFDVNECAASEARVVSEAEARAGAPVGERCTMLVARRADRTWLIGVRPATRAVPTRGGGSLAVVTVTAGGEGVTHIDYAR